jgi:hypothetical protein
VHVAYAIAVSGSIPASTLGAARVNAAQHTALSTYSRSPANRCVPPPALFAPTR